MISDLLIRLRALFQRKAVESELEDELQFHFDQQVEKFVQSGMSPSEAHRRARLVFGGSDQIKEECREARGVHFLETSAQDIRYGSRMLYRDISFTVVAVLALALGIGVNVVAFTAYKAFFHKSLDARDPGKMVNLALVLHSGNIQWLFSYPDYETYRERVHSFTDVIARSDEFLILSDAGGSDTQRDATTGSLGGRLGLFPANGSNKESTSTGIVSENYFSVLGVAPLRGRTFESMDKSELGTSPPVLISENYWQRRFGGDPALLGRTIRLNGVAVTVIGITPRDFAGTSLIVPDFWLPLSVEPLLHTDRHPLNDREDLSCRLFARLAPGASMKQGQAEMALLADHLRSLHDPQSDLGKPAAALVWAGSPFPYPVDRLPGAILYAILLIMLAAGMVLVIACANVASLQLARAKSRQNELSMRLSLGASRLRLVRQLLTESALLGLLAGIIALLFSWTLMKVLATVAAESFFPPEFGAIIFNVTPDLTIFAYVFAISLVAGILFGLAPALESSRSALSPALKANAATSPVRSRRLHNFFIAAQVSVALALMIAASMLIRSSIHALKVDTGYETKHVVDFTLKFPDDAKYTTERKDALVHELGRRIASMPGVAAVTHANAPVNGYPNAPVSLNGEIASDQNKRAVICYTYVQANYFETLGIPLLSGHNFPSQPSQSDRSVIISESAAKLLWPGEKPIGRNFRLGTEGHFHRKSNIVPDGSVYRVIGVARDTRGATFDGSDSNLVYLRLPEDRLPDYSILVRTQSDPQQFIGTLLPLISSIDPDLPVDSSTFEEMLRVSATVFLPGFAATIASPVGLIGLLLTVMGIYGTVSYIVALRTREVGIRMALGAEKRAILGLMLNQSMRPVVAGLIAGMFLAVGVSYLLRGALHGLSTIDSISFVGVSATFIVVALLAAYLPSRRAMSVDPMVALRDE